MATKDLSPEKAARLIIDLVNSGAADTADAAVDQNPDLAPGLDFLKEAAELVSASGQPKKARTTRSSGSGSALLRR